MLLSRCTGLVLGIALGWGLPSALVAGEQAKANAEARASATPKLAAFGVARYQLIRQDPAGGRLWWIFDDQDNPVGSLEYRPGAPASDDAGPGGDAFTLRFKEETLQTWTTGPRAVFRRNEDAPVAYVFDEKSHRFVTDAPPGAEASNRPLVRLLSALLKDIRGSEGWAPLAGFPAAPPRHVEPLEGEPPCTGPDLSAWSLGIVRSQACEIATAALFNKCTDASAGACVGCCRKSESCDCACVPETDFYCYCIRTGTACAPACPPPTRPLGCQTENCNIDCFQVALNKVPAGRIVYSGTCHFALECECDAWVNTCNPADNSRDVVYSSLQRCPGDCGTCGAGPSADSASSCGDSCGAGFCEDPYPTCCFDSYCAPNNADCCTDGGSCPGGWHCCDDGTSSCCPDGYTCCWTGDGPACCGGGDTRPEGGQEPLYTPRLQKNQPALSPKPKE